MQHLSGILAHDAAGGQRMKWIIIFIHTLGNPSYETPHRFSTRVECEAKRVELERIPVPQWYFACIEVTP